MYTCRFSAAHLYLLFCNGLNGRRVRTTGRPSWAPRLSCYGADVAIHAECFWTSAISKLCCFGLLLGYSSFRSLKEPGRITFWTSTKRNSHKRLKYCRMCSAPERWDRVKPWMHCTCVKDLLIWQWWCKSSLFVFIDRAACISLEIIGHYLARQIIKITQNRTVQYLVKQINTALMLNIYVTEFIISEDLVAPTTTLLHRQPLLVSLWVVSVFVK